MNNNCYSDCENAVQIVKSLINKVKFLRIEQPKLTDSELKDFEKFKTVLHTAFQSGEEESFEKLLVNQSLMLELIETKLNDETMKQRFSEIIQSNWNEFSKEFVDRSKRSFVRLIDKGKDLGINWKKIELIDVNYTLGSTIPGITSAKCEYEFLFQGRKFKITIASVEPLREGWFISKLDNSFIEEI